MSNKENGSFIFKVLFSTLTGTAAFLLLFDYFKKGGNRMDTGSGTMNYGYASGDLLGGLLFFLIKFLLVVVVVAAIAGVVIWIKNNFFKDSASTAANNLTHAINSDPVLKLVTTVTLAILGVVLVFSIFDSFSRPGIRVDMGYGYGFNAANSITWFLNLVVQLLVITFVVSIAGAAFVYIKKEIEKGTLNFSGKKKPETDTHTHETHEEPKPAAQEPDTKQ